MSNNIGSRESLMQEVLIDQQQIYYIRNTWKPSMYIFELDG
jgi:hypothetical protein